MAAKKAAKKAAPKKAAPKKSAATKPAAKKMAAATSDVIQKFKGVMKPRNATSYTYSEFLENIRGFCGLKKRSHAKEVCEDISRFIKESLRHGFKIPLMGLGKLYVRHSQARMGRNPATGEPVHIPAKKRVRFTPAKKLKEEVLSR
jgi:DNA-binding protein HU-beta